MHSVSSWIENPGVAGVIVEAILLTIAGIAVLLAFILLRRGWRSCLFRQRDARVLEIRSMWNDILSGKVPPEEWRDDPLSSEIVESMLLDRLEVADAEEAVGLVDCLRTSGLIDLRIQHARRRRGWRRRRALASLGRMRAREAVPALAEALDDANRGHVLTAVRGLGRLGLPHAAVPMLDRVIAGQLGSVPAMPIQDALLGCCRGSPQLLVPYVHRATPETRPLLSRVLGELATGELDPDELIMLTCDEQAEVRASAARALPTAPLNVALAGLGALAESDEWFVRLRAVAGLGQLQHPRAIPLLVEGLCDLNRFVRLRSAAGLARFDAHLEEILDLVEEKKDRYAMQALLSELESSGAILKQVDCLGSRGDTRERAERVLQRSLHLGAHRLLVSMLRAHRSRRVRFSLARLLAASGTPALVPLLERAHTNESSRRQQAVIAWVLGQLQAAAKSAGKRRRKAGLRAVPTA